MNAVLLRYKNGSRRVRETSNQTAILLTYLTSSMAIASAVASQEEMPLLKPVMAYITEPMSCAAILCGKVLPVYKLPCTEP